MYSIIDIPGYTHTAESGWHPDFRHYLSQAGHSVETLNLPGGKYPVLDEWYPIILDNIQKAQSPVVLVGHSLGTRAVLATLEMAQVSVYTAILIAPFDNNVENARFRNGNYANFFNRSLSIETIKQAIQSKPLVIGSIDDQNIPYHQAQNLAQDLGAKLISLDQTGHFLDPKWAKVLGELVVKKLAV